MGLMDKMLCRAKLGRTIADRQKPIASLQIGATDQIEPMKAAKTEAITMLAHTTTRDQVVPTIVIAGVSPETGNQAITLVLINSLVLQVLRITTIAASRAIMTK